MIHEDFLLGKSIQGARVYLYPHLHFSIGYNNDQIVTANVTTDARRRVDITDVTTGQEVNYIAPNTNYTYWSLNRLYFLIQLNGFTHQLLSMSIE